MEKNFKKSNKSIFLYIGLTILVIALAILIALAVNKKPSTNTVSEQANVPTKYADNKSSKDIIKKDGIKNSEKTVQEKEQEKNEAIVTEKKEEKYTEEYKEYIELPDEKKHEVDVIPREEEIEYEVIEEIIEEQEKDLKEEVIKEDEMPARFDLRDVINIKVESQAPFGLCWDFTTMSCVETNLALTQGKEYDFSEAHVDYLTSNLMSTNYRDIHDAGNFKMFIDYTENYDGFILDEDLPLGDYPEYEYSTFLDMKGVNETVIKTVDFPTYYPTDDWTDEEFSKYQNTIKNHIKNYGGIYMATMGHSSDTNWYYSNNEYLPEEGHAVTIIGWDDNYSKDNFMSPSGQKPSKDGAYIFLNSWGTSFGENGFGYISYEDYFVHTALSGIVSTNIGDAINLDKLNNKQLANYIKNEYKEDLIIKNGISYIKPTVLDSIWTLDLSNQNLTSLEDIELFAHVSSLNLSGNNITDVSALEKLKSIYCLDLSNMNDVTGYENLTSLGSLNLRNCNFKDINKLSNLKNLENLDLSENKDLINIEKLSEFNLWTLTLEDCNLKDITEISKIKFIRELNLSKNKEIENLEVLQNMEDLGMLYLSDCEIKDANKVPQKYFWYLDLSNNSNITNINKLTNVAYLVLNNCDISDLSVLPESEVIIGFSLKNNKFKDVTPINDKNIEFLSELNLSENIGLTGSLSKKDIACLILNNCELDKDFDFFGIQALNSLVVKGNDITIQDITSKINCNQLSLDAVKNFDKNILPEYTMLFETTIYMDIEVPKADNAKFYYSKLFNIYDENAIKCETGTVQGYYEYIKLDTSKDGTIYVKGADSNELFWSSDLVINYKVVEDLKPTELVISKKPDKLFYINDEPIDLTGIIVRAIYDNVVVNRINDYTVIANPENFVNGDNTVIISKNGTTAEFIIKYSKEYDYITLNCKSRDLYSIMQVQLPQDEVVSFDEANRSIVITPQGLEKISNIDLNIEDSMINDLVNVPELNLKNITIQYYGQKITQEQVEILRQFPELKSITIYNWTNNDDVIVEQDYFEVKIIKG